MSISINTSAWVEKAYAEASPKDKIRAELLAEYAIKDSLIRNKDDFYENNKNKLLATMAEISREAKEKGLTEEILKEILNSDVE